MIPQFDPLDERYRWCIYCRADCWPERDSQRHDTDCPTETGVYPVTDDERDPNGDLPLCCRCSAPFQLDQHYAVLDLDTGRPSPRPELGEVVCLGCAAVAEVSRT